MSTNTGLLSKVLMFTVGAAIGSAVTYILMRRKYENIEVYTDADLNQEYGQDDDATYSHEDSEADSKEQDMVQYHKYVKRYSGNSLMDDVEENMKGVTDVDRPYLISVEEYAELDDYEVISLYYYEDDVLTDELGNVIDDVDDTVGIDNLKKFDDIGVDSIYIRNDARQSDYEVLRDMGRYYDEHPKED